MKKRMLSMGLCAFAAISFAAASADDPSTKITAAPTPYPRPTNSKLSTEQEKLGWDIALNACMTCHSADMLSQQRLSEAQWQKECIKMKKWGAIIDDEQTTALAAYLADRFPVGMPMGAPPVVPSKQLFAVLEPLPDGKFGNGDVAAGKKLFGAECASCHGDAGMGEVGPRLIDRPLIYRARDFVHVTRNGRAQMPAFPKLSDKQMASLLAYLRTLPEPEPKQADAKKQ